MSSVCIDVKPARLVESAAAPSEPMRFRLRERGREGAERSEEKRGPGEGGWGRLMHLSSSCCHPWDLITTAERARERERARGEEEGAVPHRHLALANVCVCVCVCVSVCVCVYPGGAEEGARGWTMARRKQFQCTVKR
jgi:hypothetical protein